MKIFPAILSFAFLFFATGCKQEPVASAGDGKVIRVAVIGGMTQSGMWPELTSAFEKDSGMKLELIVTGPKAVISEPFRKGEIDLITLHSSDEATDLVAHGYGTNMRPWARNEHTIVGPSDDPAGIRGMKSGAEALKKIAATKSNIVDFYGPGSREVTHKLWQRAGLKPEGEWVLKDESKSPQQIVEFAETKHAYVVVGKIPVLNGKIPKGNSMEVLVQGDPDMRRPYVVVEVNPAKFPKANATGAKVLADWMAGEKGQEFIRAFGRQQPGGIPLFHPAGG